MEGWRRVVLAGLLLTLVASVVGCGSKRRAQAPGPPPAGGLPPMSGESETGLASWYGDPYHGRPTASGEVYDMGAYTAAHRTLPFNTWVRVTSLENNLFTTVRVNDRGPFIEGRIIDLSRAAADALRMIGAGTMLVRVEVVRHPEGAGAAAGSGLYSVQVGAFQAEENAMHLQADLVREYGDVFIQSYDAPDGRFYRVRVGHLNTYDEAEDLALGLRSYPGVTSAFVVRLD
jgi:rare lipoprotein A